MWHRHHPHSQETPTLCTAQSRGFVFILRSFAPSARGVAAEVKHHRKPMAMLLLPSAIYAPEIERMWSVQAAVQIAQSREVEQIEVVELVVCAIQFVRFVIGSDVEGGESILRAVELVRKQGTLSSKSWPFLPKSCAVRVEISGFFSRRCGAASHLSVFSRHSAWRCAKKIPRCLSDSGGMSFAARPSGKRGTRSGLSTWRRRTMSCSQCYLSFFSWPNRMV